MMKILAEENTKATNVAREAKAREARAVATGGSREARIAANAEFQAVMDRMSAEASA